MIDPLKRDSLESILRLNVVENVVLSSGKVNILSKVEGVLSEQARLESIEKYKCVGDFLKPYQKKCLAEDQIRELIHHTGIQTFPRPKRVP